MSVSNQTGNTMCWSRHETCLLLKILRKYPILYDPTDPAYELQTLRTNAYQQISDELKVYKPDVTPVQVRNKFKILKQQYLVEKKMKEEFLMKHKTPDVTYTPKLWCYFLMDFFEEKIVVSQGKRRSVKRPSFTTVLLNESDDCKEIEGVNTFEDVSSNRGETPTPSPVSTRSDVSAKCLQLVDDLINTFNTIKQEREKETEKRSDESPQTFLGMMIESELSNVDEEVYDEAKWKIIRILQEASKRHRAVKNEPTQSSQFKVPSLPETVSSSQPDGRSANKKFNLGNGVQLVMLQGSRTPNSTTSKLNSTRIKYNGLNKYINH